MSAIPQDAALRLQLAAICGNEPPTSYLEIRPLGLDGRPARRAFVPVRNHALALAQIAALAPDFNVFIGAAPRARENGTARAVERAWALWADCDSAASAAALRSFRPLPSIVIRSGTGENVHAWWPLRQHVPPEWARRANRRLALKLGADRAATDPARILRPAGTLNHKHAPPARVVCVRLELDVFRLLEVVGGLPDPPEYLPTGKPGPCSAPESMSLAALARAVREAPVGSRNNLLNWAAWRARAHIDARQLDERDVRAALRDAALAAGLGETEAERTLLSALDARAVA